MASGGERRLRVFAERAVCEELAGLFEDSGALRAEVSRAEAEPCVTALLDADAPGYIEDRVEAWLNLIEPARRSRLETARGEGPWQPGWRGLYTGADVGSFRVRPSWQAAGPRAAGEHLIVIDPHGGFGSGMHPSTQLALRLIEREGQGGGARCLDVGAGSGILSVAAALLGWAPIALELEASARAACRRTAAENGVLVEVREELLQTLGVRAPLVIANIPGSALTRLAKPLLRCLAPGGTLILSGMYREELEPVLAALGLGPGAPLFSSEGAWAAATLRLTPHDIN